MANGLNGQEVSAGATSLPSEADKTLSGTPKVFTVKDDVGADYYQKFYPTKA